MKITDLSIEILFGAPTGPLLLSSRNQQIFGLDPQTIILRGRYHLPRTVGGVKHHLKWSRNRFFSGKHLGHLRNARKSLKKLPKLPPILPCFRTKNLGQGQCHHQAPHLPFPGRPRHQRCCEQCGRQVSKQRTFSSTSLCRMAPHQNQLLEQQTHLVIQFLKWLIPSYIYNYIYICIYYGGAPNIPKKNYRQKKKKNIFT